MCNVLLGSICSLLFTAVAITIVGENSWQRRTKPNKVLTVEVSLYVKGFGAAAVRQSAAMKNFAKK